MDPNETLKRIRELMRAEFTTKTDELDAFAEVTDLFLELDRWIVSGGFPPAVWRDAFNSRPKETPSDDPWQDPNSALKGEEPF